MKEITLQELCCYLNELLRVADFNDYCPNGVQVEGKSSIRSIATAVSASLETIQAAVDCRAEVLIVHHGMFWKGDSFPVCGVKKEKLQLLLKNEISLLAYHLPLDAHPLYGNNWKAANDLGWRNLTPFGLFNGNPIGVYGEFDPMPREAFKKLLVDYYGHEANVAEGGKEIVKSACLISGGAYKMLSEAAAISADCFVTGNFDEPAWHDAHEQKINFYAMGHSSTERIGPLAISRHIENHLGVSCNFIDVCNPF